MAGKRIRGEDVTVEILLNSSPVEALTFIKSFEFTYQLEIKTEGFLGKTTNDKDSVFQGIKGRMEIQTNTKKSFEFIQTIVDRARRRASGARVNIKATYKFPNGERARLTIPDPEFGEFPVQSSGRSEYITTSIDFEASEARVVLT